MTPTKYQPKRLHKVLAHAWQKLVASRRRLKILALGKGWEFQFVLGIAQKHAALLSNGVAANIRLGDHAGAIRCALVSGGPWLSELLRGPNIESIQEPFRSAVVGVILQDFLQSLSQSSHFPLQIVTEALAPQQAIPLYWQMLSDRNQVEIFGSLSADEGLVGEICSITTNWKPMPWELPDSFRVSVDVLLDSFSVAKSSTYLETGDIFILGEFTKWREGSLLMRVKYGLQDGSVIPIKVPRSPIESTIFSKWNWRTEYHAGDEGDSSLSAGAGGVSAISMNMSKTQQKIEGGENNWMDSVEVMLEFSIGRHTISLGELKRLGQGHIFPINPAANGLVDIVVQGQSIGRGELVQLGEAVGVLVREIGEIHQTGS